MLIGIKYCGGCNSRYDRVKFVNSIKEKFSHINFCSVEKQKEVDYLLVVCGCGATCASTQGIKSKYGRTTIKTNEQEQEVIENINNINQKQHK